MSCHNLQAIPTCNWPSPPKNKSWSSWHIPCLHLPPQAAGLHGNWRGCRWSLPSAKRGSFTYEGLLAVLKDGGSGFKQAGSWTFYTNSYSIKTPLPSPAAFDNTGKRVKCSTSKNKGAAWSQWGIETPVSQTLWRPCLSITLHARSLRELQSSIAGTARCLICVTKTWLFGVRAERETGKKGRYLLISLISNTTLHMRTPKAHTTQAFTQTYTTGSILHLVGDGLSHSRVKIQGKDSSLFIKETCKPSAVLWMLELFPTLMKISSVQMLHFPQK